MISVGTHKIFKPQREIFLKQTIPSSFKPSTIFWVNNLNPNEALVSILSKEDKIEIYLGKCVNLSLLKISLKSCQLAAQQVKCLIGRDPNIKQNVSTTFQSRLNSGINIMEKIEIN